MAIINLQLSRILESSQVVNINSSGSSASALMIAPETDDTQDSQHFCSSSTSAVVTDQTPALRRSKPNGELSSTSWWVLGNKLLGIADYESETTSTVVEQRKQNRTSKSCLITGQRTRVRVWPPSWLSSRAWEAFCGQSYGEWKFVFRAYNIVTRQSPIVACIEAGDLGGIRELFARKEATPYDKDQYGYSLLWVRLYCSHWYKLLTR